MTRTRVVVTCNQAVADRDYVSSLLSALGVDCHFVGSAQQLARNEVIAACAGATAVIAGDEHYDRHVIESLPDLRLIVRWGIGVDNVDQVAATECGVLVRNTPGVFSDTVAEVALGYLISLVRGLALIDRKAKDGQWFKYRGRSLSELTVGLVGLGSIGTAFAQMTGPLVQEILAFDFDATFGRRRSEEIDVRFENLDRLFATSDAIILTCALSEDSRGLVDMSRLETMKRDSVIINVSRGPVIVEADLASALSLGLIGGAALDVFETEPLPSDSPLRLFDNILLGSHNGSNSQGACLRTHREVVRIVSDFLEDYQ